MKINGKSYRNTKVERGEDFYTVLLYGTAIVHIEWTVGGGGTHGVASGGAGMGDGSPAPSFCLAQGDAFCFSGGEWTSVRPDAEDLHQHQARDDVSKRFLKRQD